MKVSSRLDDLRPRVWVCSFALGFALALCGCQTERRWVGGGVAPNVPLVTLESVTATKESISWGYPVFQFPRVWFPLEMLRASVGGEVVVREKVGADGVVQSVTMLRSTHREFEPYALAGVNRWRFVEFVPTALRSPHGYTVDCLIKFGFDES